MKVQIDSNNYLTGSYSDIGDSSINSIDMDSLPDCEPIYYSSYKIVPKQIEKTIIVIEEVLKQREIAIPVLDENDNETYELETQIEEYIETIPVEKSVTETEYHYELDEDKKAEIDAVLASLPSESAIKPVTLTDINNQLTDVQIALCSLYERLEV